MREKITSRNNIKIKNVCKLVSSPAYRKENGLFVAEGFRLCMDAAESGIKIKELYITEKAELKFSEYAERLFASSENIYAITDEVAERLADTKTTQGVFAVCNSIVKKLFYGSNNKSVKYIATDNIQTPDNLGAVLRTAEALGIDGVIIGSGCDIYNPKVLRASMGAVFRLPIAAVDDLTDVLCELKKKKITVIASVPNASAVKITDFNVNGGVVCIIGNEGNGISENILNLSDIRVTIPMQGRAESLNAAAAAAILMWELVKN